MYAAILLLGLAIGVALGSTGIVERFVDVTETSCNVCNKPKPKCSCTCASCGKPAPSCGCHSGQNPKIDWSKYILKASIPPCPAQPDMSRYMLKTECPAPLDMSRYILKSAVPACPPCISTCNKPCKIGDCPPCPRPRCPPPTTCPPCAAVEPPRCSAPKPSCSNKAEEPWAVRPMLASVSGF